MEKQIYLPSAAKKRLEREFKVTKATVWAALNYTTQSLRANMLRKVALERGGVIYPATVNKPAVKQAKEEFDIDCETTFDTAANKMTQVFSPRVQLTANLTTGEVGIYIDNELRTTVNNPSISELMCLQMDVQDIANQLKS